MARTRFNPKLVKIHFSLTVEEIARTLGAHKNTVRGWLQAGLEANDSRRAEIMRELRQQGAPSPTAAELAVRLAALEAKVEAV